MLRTVSLQIVLVIVVAALGSLYWGAPGARDILLGGLACAVPNVLFALVMLVSGVSSLMVYFKRDNENRSFLQLLRDHLHRQQPHRGTPGGDHRQAAQLG